MLRDAGTTTNEMFNWRYRVNGMAGDKNDAFGILQKTVEQKDPDGFEEALRACFPIQHREGLCELLCEALVADWHLRHEDVALAIQYLKCAGAVEALERRAASNPDYLAWDENHTLARKCTWALADIGSESAKQALERLSKSDILVVRGFAQKRIDNWHPESSRKGC